MTTTTTPLAKPGPGSTVPEPRVLDDLQESKYNEVLAFCRQLERVPVKDAGDYASASETVPISDADKMWLTRECILRYLRATKWKVDDCKRRLVKTLIWRHTFGVDPESSLSADVVEVENASGKQVILGFDNDARPVLMLKTGRQNTQNSHRQVQHLVYMLERVIDMMPPGQDQLALLIDFQHVKGITGGSKLPSLSTGREVLSILQDHYPERLGKGLCINIPRIAALFLRLIHPFIDPLTREKLVFSEPMINYVPAESLEDQYGGSVHFEYDHSVYWPALTAMAAERRLHYHRRFKALGGTVGLSESDLRKEDETERSENEKSQQQAQIDQAEKRAQTEVDQQLGSSSASSSGSTTPSSEDEYTDAVDAADGLQALYLGEKRPVHVAEVEAIGAQ